MQLQCLHIFPTMAPKMLNMLVPICISQTLDPEFVMIAVSGPHKLELDAAALLAAVS